MTDIDYLMRLFDEYAEGNIEVQVADNGRGINSGEHPLQHYGTNIMKERGLSLNSERKIQPGPKAMPVYDLYSIKSSNNTTLELVHD